MPSLGAARGRARQLRCPMIAGPWIPWVQACHLGVSCAPYLGRNPTSWIDVALDRPPLSASDGLLGKRPEVADARCASYRRVNARWSMAYEMTENVRGPLALQVAQSATSEHCCVGLCQQHLRMQAGPCPRRAVHTPWGCHIRLFRAGKASAKVRREMHSAASVLLFYN
jgi:hypothetical protein